MAPAESAKLPRSLWMVFAGLFINRFGSFVNIFLVLYLISQGYTLLQAGAAVSAYGLGSVGASAFGGYLADRLGRRTTIIFSMFSSAATMLILSQTSTLPLIILLVGLAGLTTELYRPAANALIADLVPSGQRVRAYALSRFCINLGFAAGSAVAGFLASRSFLLIFVGDALTSVFFGLLALFALSPRIHSQVKQDPTQSRLFQTVRSDHRFLLFLLASLMITFVYFQSQSTFALQVYTLGLSNALYGTLISLNGFLIVFLELPISTLTQRLPMSSVIATGFLLIGLGFGLIAFASTFPRLALTVGIWTLGEMIHAPVSAAYVANVAPPHLRGRYQGVWGLTWSSGLILGPLLGTLIFSWSAEGFWLICGGLGMISALLIVIDARKPERESAS